MKKNDYQKPTMTVVRMSMESSLLSNSPGYDVIGPGKSNTPAGAPRRNDDSDKGNTWGHGYSVWDN